jgi:tetratricopeptide (TPR) repeat protein
MVRATLKLVLAGALTANIFAASGDYAYLAKRFLSQGRYGSAYDQYTRALGEARKEANLVSEGRILISMATLTTHAMEYEEAKKLFDLVHINVLDEKSKENYYKAYMEFYNLQGKYKEAFEIANKHSFKNASSAFLGEAAIAAAGSKNSGEADAYLKKINKKDSPGQFAFYKARVADLNGEQSKELYENALLLSTEKKQYYVSGIILLRLTEITGNKGYAIRSSQVFSELGLAKPFQKAEEAAK